jgi:hypothetical protein
MRHKQNQKNAMQFQNRAIQEELNPTVENIVLLQISHNLSKNRRRKSGLKKIKLKLNEKTIEVIDYRHAITDYRILNGIDFSKERPSFIPFIEAKFFESQRYSLPVVKLDDKTYIFPLSAKATGKSSTIDDYSDFCIVNLDLLVTIQNYYYYQAKVANDRDLHNQKRRTQIRKGGSNSMSWVQYNLATLIHGSEKRWVFHRELQEEIKYKVNDIKFQTEELENVFSIGEQTSYGDDKLNDKLFKRFGVRVKLQNGGIIQESHIQVIERSLSKFHKTFGRITNICSDFTLKISYSRDTHMHARNAVGLFAQYFNVVGISDKGNIEQTLAHEMGHFLDFYLGDPVYRFYLSDDKDSLCGQIAKLFRKHMVTKQTSNYQNRTKECFARAIEQYYSITNRIEVENSQGNYCSTQVFNEHLMPLILEFKNRVSKVELSLQKAMVENWLES